MDKVLRFLIRLSTMVDWQKDGFVQLMQPVFYLEKNNREWLFSGGKIGKKARKIVPFEKLK